MKKQRHNDYREHRKIEFFIFADEKCILMTLPQEYSKVVAGVAFAGCVEFGDSWVYLVYNPCEEKFNLEVVGDETNEQVQDLLQNIRQHFSAMKWQYAETSFQEVMEDVRGYKGVATGVTKN